MRDKLADQVEKTCPDCGVTHVVIDGRPSTCSLCGGPL
jgi:hypothetical protein